MTDRTPLGDTPYSFREELLHSISHGVGAALSLAGMATLIVLASVAAHVDPWKIVGVSLYGITLLLLYTASTLYHGVRHPKLKRAFQMLDHCAIYALIAGTYTPFLLVNLRGSLGWTLFAVVWGLALGGIVLKLIWPHRFGVLRISVYLVMGWLVVLAFGELSAALTPTSLALLIAGGVTYSLGVIVFVFRTIPYNHAIWHGFVLGGSGFHYAAIYTGVLPATVM